MSNSDLLKQEIPSFSNVRMPLTKDGGLDTEELPFIVGVIDDFSGNAERSLKKRGKLEDRSFDPVSRYTFDKKLADVSPGLDLVVKCTLPNTTEKELPVKLNFKAMKDFEPRNVAEQIDPLRNLLRMRESLVSLRNRSAADPETRKELEKLVGDIMAIVNRKNKEKVKHE
ncbi:MAG TPA: type VI secretion system contractile sheath small subunit [Tepidisphaeraceae bacterium]|jgi:type VI secretion system protein ImpB|nr:type VI secretion system contractile sheath small subunit [Tepidisphaeraceae bacterium]